MSKINVIIVDDRTLYRNSLSRIISGYKDIEVVGIASSGCEYLLHAHKAKPDIALINTRLNTSDAICTLKLSLELFPEIRAIAITFLNDTETHDELKQAGFYDILTKDSTGKEIIKVIRCAYRNQNKNKHNIKNH